MISERMLVPELAKRLGKSPVWVADELRRDSKRDVKQWPFATSTKSDSGQWSYVILRQKFEKWYSGESEIDYARLADMVAERVVDQLKGA